MPAINEAAFTALKVLAEKGRNAYINHAELPDEQALARKFGTTLEAANAATAEHPEALAILTDAYTTALSDHPTRPMGGMFSDARADDRVDPNLVNLGLLMVATGLKMNPKSGTINYLLYLPN